MTPVEQTSAEPTRIFAVANRKGGVGKTTTAINLGTALAELGLRTLVLDLDPQGNASTGLGSQSTAREHTSYDVLAGSAELADAVVPTSVKQLRPASRISRSFGIDVELVDDPDRARRLRRLLRDTSVSQDYKYVLIDCPPSLNLLTVNAMVAADAVIVPLQCEFFALEGLSQLLQTIKRVQGSLNPSLHIHGIVLTMFDQRNRLSSQVADDVRSNLGKIVYDTMIPRNVRLSEAPSHSLPALIYDSTCAGSKAYRSLAAELLQRDRSVETA